MAETSPDAALAIADKVDKVISATTQLTISYLQRYSQVDAIVMMNNPAIGEFIRQDVAKAYGVFFKAVSASVLATEEDSPVTAEPEVVPNA